MIPALSTRGRVWILLAYVGVTFFSFPHPVGEGVLDAGGLVSWWGPALLVWGLWGLSPGRAALAAIAAGWVAHACILHWFFVVTVTYGHAPFVVGLLAPIGAALYPALLMGIFGLGWGAWTRNGGSSPFFAAALWTAVDYLRSFVFTGFPWATLGYAQHENPALMGLASLTGVYGMSFVVFLGGASLATALAGFRRTGRFPASAGWGLVAVLALQGVGWVARPAPMVGERIRVAAIQGDIDQGFKWDPDWAEDTLRIYEELSRQAIREGAEVVVWPETAVPYGIRNGQAPERVLDLAVESGATFVVGAVAVDGGGGDRSRDARFYDSAFVVPPGSGGARYDKSHLVPFGESVPLRDLLGGFIRGVATGIANNDVTPGAGPRALELGHGEEGALRVGVPICYELLFPDLVRRFAGDGARVLFALTNDAWYGRTGAPYQFLAMTAVRSAESGLWTVRAANSGVSAMIDARGEVKESLPIFERGLLVADVPLRSLERPPTFYVKAGDLFALACSAAAVGCAIVLFRRGRGDDDG